MGVVSEDGPWRADVIGRLHRATGAAFGEVVCRYPGMTWVAVDCGAWVRCAECERAGRASVVEGQEVLR